MRRLAAIAVLPMLLGGCLNAWHSNYKCKGIPEGVHCQSVRETYAQTNYQEALGPNSKDGGLAPAPAAGNPSSTDGAPVQGLGYAGPLPLRTPAQVIRIWVAPWESQDGRLHLANYIYAEVQERQWSIGERRMRVAPAITALEAVTPPEKSPASRPAGSRSSAPSPKVDKNQAIFPDTLQRPRVHNQDDLNRFQQMPGRLRSGEGGGTAEK